MKSLKVVLLFVASLGLLAYGCAKSDDSEAVVEKLLHMKEKIYLQKQLITFQAV